MKTAGRPTSSNIEDRRPTKIDKHSRGLPVIYINTSNKAVPLSNDGLNRVSLKWASFNDRSPDGVVSKTPDKKIDASSKEGLEQAPPPLPRKRPSQTYIEAPKPRPRLRRYGKIT